METYLTSTFVAALLALSACNDTGKAPGSSSQAHAHAHAQQAEAPHHSSGPAAAPVAQPAEEPAATIPEFKFYRLKSGFGYEKSDIPAGRNTVFILFDPSCGHCQLETGALAKNYTRIKDVNLFFVSMNDPGLMANFLPSFGKELDGKPNVEMLYDRDQEFIRKFHIPKMFPANYVYGPDGKLKIYWAGEKEIDQVLSAFVR